jgi:hypothetical protein
VDIAEELPTVISFCSGYGGIERGLDLAGVEHRVIAYVEIEAFAIANLVAKMESGQLVPAPIFTDLKTFPAHLFRDCVDIITGGYPCQPFSAAGKRLGTEDPRHLWPYILDHIQSIRPVRCIFENVEGHISLGLREVIGDLEGAGYDATWGIFSQRLKSVRPTSESGFTYSVPTPTVGMEAPNKNANTKGPKNLMDVATGDWQHLVPRCDAKAAIRRREKRDYQENGRQNGNVYQSLPSQVHAREAKHNLWPTPASRDYRSVTGREHLQRDNCMQNLNVAAVYRQTWPTPAARDYKGRSGAGPSESTQGILPSLYQTQWAMKSNQKRSGTSKVGHLNPDWVEWLMGVPTGWTELGSWETE